MPDRRIANPPKLDCYAYIRGAYGVPAYIGVRVILRGGTAGVLVDAKHPEQYLHVRLDGASRISGPYHPTDGITYDVTGRPVPEPGA